MSGQPSMSLHMLREFLDADRQCVRVGGWCMCGKGEGTTTHCEQILQRVVLILWRHGTANYRLSVH